MLNSVIMLEQSRSDHPDKIAVVSNSVRLNYTELSERVNRLGNGLRGLGIGKDDKVLLVCPNHINFPIIYYALLKIGAVSVAVNILSKKPELVYYMEDTGAKAFLCFENQERLAIGDEGWAAFKEVDGCENFVLITDDEVAECGYDGGQTIHELMNGESSICDTEITQADDTAVILYTSGTTGKAKGAELTHQNLFTTAMNFRDVSQVTSDDIHLVVLPLFHTYGQTVQMNCAFLASSTIVLMARFDADEMLAMMEKENVTIFAGVPTMYWALLNKADPEAHDIAKIASNLRIGVSGGAAIPVEVLRGVEEKLGITIIEGYGLSETSSSTTFNRIDRPRKVGSIGTPQWGVEVRIVDEEMNDVAVGQEGEVVIRGHCVMKGYYNRPEETAEAFRGGWFHTGDIGKKDEDGYFYIVDRLKDMIIRGGYNVYPREVEERMIEHPAISLVAVIGVPDGKYGEEIKAYVVLSDGETITTEEIIAWTKERVSAYKYPRIVEIVDSLPMSATGKILKKELRKAISD